MNINSSAIGFNGHKIGLSGFKACFHDDKVDLVKQRIGKVSTKLNLNWLNILRNDFRTICLFVLELTK